MTQSLPQVAQEHQERLSHVVDRMPEIADRLLEAGAPEAAASTRDLDAFLTGTLLPHLDATEQTLYPELERMFQNRHSMRPMRREHDEIRKLVGQYATLAAPLEQGHPSLGATLALRRVMFTLYAQLKVHLAEERAYLRILERGVDTEMAEALAAALEHPVAG